MKADTIYSTHTTLYSLTLRFVLLFVIFQSKLEKSSFYFSLEEEQTRMKISF